MKYVTEFHAKKCATEEWPIERIKAVHDRHTHKSNGMEIEHSGCPNCTVCRCPVPLAMHRDSDSDWVF